MTYTCNPSICEAEARGLLQVQGQPRLHTETKADKGRHGGACVILVSIRLRLEDNIFEVRMDSTVRPASKKYLSHIRHGFEDWGYQTVINKTGHQFQSACVEGVYKNAEMATFDRFIL